MRPVYAVATHIVSSLGLDVPAHWKAVTELRSGIERIEDASCSATPFFASRLSPAQWQVIHTQTATNKTLSAFEQLCVYSAQQAADAIELDTAAADTAFVLSTTKGNIELLQQAPDEQITLSYSAQTIAAALGLHTKPFTVSHACVSGVVALQYALSLLQRGRYRNVIVTGADRFSRFVLNGFQSFQAVADAPCRPFDAERKGINLGEAAATIILSTDPQYAAMAQLVSGSTSNDANHISGPSRTGDELAMAINNTLLRAGITAAEVGILSAHGTATLYNDEMESKAFDTAGLAQTPMHSLKGFIGHTLGAAGVAESVLLVESLQQQMLIPSAGFAQLGVPKQLNVTLAATPANIHYALKTASGFGGCNATALWAKV